MSNFYRPLDSERNEIRLIQVLPPSAGDQLRCIIKYSELGPGLVYEALSYAWKDHTVTLEDISNKPASITVGNISHLNITENLALFLRYVQRSGQTDKFFWIDAISINQTDIPERNAQVLRMGEIYRSAQRVVVWLGPEGNDSLSALNFIERDIYQDASDQSIDITHIWSSTTLTSIAREVTSGRTILLWEAVARLFERTWWSRTWVVQEVLLAPELTFVCGDREIGWTSLWRFLESLWAHSQASTFCLAGSTRR